MARTHSALSASKTLDVVPGHELGVRVALDDFGSGYSNLGYLQRFPLDKIKIDQSFVAALGRSSNGGVIIQAMVALGRALGLSVLVEGVETEHQRVLLRLAGCDEMQGFLFAKPAPANSIDALLEKARQDGMVTTKVQPTFLAPHDLERSVKESLARLRLDVIDLLLIHWPNPRVPLAETLGAMAKMKREGYARQIGVSNFTVALLDEANKISSEPLVCDQVECHPFLNQDKVVAACRKHKMAVVAYSPIARGGAKGDKVLEKIGKGYGKSAAQVCLRWLVQRGIVVIPRTSKVERLEENFALFDFELSDAEMREIAGLARRGGRIVDWTWSPSWD